MSENPVTVSGVPARRDENAEDRSSRNLLKAVRLMHTLNERERELTLVLMQAIIAWDGLARPSEPA